MEVVPLRDLRAQYLECKEDLDSAVARCVDGATFIGGPDHSAFAAEFAEYCGGGHVALCGNGTDALVLALLDLIGPGDGTGEVVTVAHTFIATAEAIQMAGYRPVFVDIDPRTCLMDLDRLEAAVGPRTRAIIPVHLYGQMVPMDRVMEIAARHGLVVVEDAAQAHGAAWKGRGPGQWGHAATFSFFPGKNLGAWGDGGAVFSLDAALIARIRMRCDHGRSGKYEHEFPGMNSRLDGLQAAVLRVKLRHLSAWTLRRRELAARYRERLAALRSFVPIACDPDAEHVHHLFVVRTPDRDARLDRLRSGGIEAGVHYPIPLHEQAAYRSLGYAPGDLPATHAAAREILSLPLYPEMTDAQFDRVLQALIDLGT